MDKFRREMVLGGAALAGFSAVGFGGAGVRLASAQEGDTVAIAELLAGGPLPEQAQGNENAPVTIVEYASLTCSHCAQFHVATYPEMKTRYIDSGKARYIFREFPLDKVSAVAFMLARCANDKYFPMVDVLFKTQDKWAFSKNPREALLGIARQAGFTKDSFEACTTNQELLDKIQAVRDAGSKKFNVRSTPTFFINGKRYVGALSVADLDKAMEPLLKS